MNISPSKGYVSYRRSRKQMRQPCLLYARWNEDYLSKTFPVLLCQWTHCLAGEILICKSKSLTSLPTNRPLTHLPLKRHSMPEDCEAYTQKADFKLFQARYKAGSCNVNSPLLSPLNTFLLSHWNLFLVTNYSLFMLTQFWPHLNTSIAPNTAKLS